MPENSFGASVPFVDDLDLFELAPVPLWLEDYSALNAHFEALRGEGVESLRDYLAADRARVAACSEHIRLLRVNRVALALYEADDLAHLEANLHRVFRSEMFAAHVEELVALWDGETVFGSRAVNYTLTGRRLDIQLKGRLLPGHERRWDAVLVVTEDVTELEEARRRAASAERYAVGLFEHSPVSLWVEDFSGIKALIDELRDRGIVDFRTFTDVHPEFVGRCMMEIRVVDVNRHTLELFGAPDKDTLILRLGDVFRDDMQRSFREQLVDLWDGALFQRREVVNYRLDGDQIHLHLQFSVLPGHEMDWSLVLVALTDITARKKAEAYLEYLGKHDVLTRLHNRSFYVDELNRLERKGPFPVTVIVADLDGLKSINDQFGHAAGDAMLRRAGEVLAKLCDNLTHAARIGGDEFAILLPGTDEAGGLALVEELQRLIDLNNKFYSGSPLGLSVGVATTFPGERLEATVRRADLLMYEAKRAAAG